MIISRKMRFSFLVIEALVLAVSLTLVNCGGGGGGGGNTVSAENSVVTAVRNSAPISACPQGGIQVDAGIDDNSNGILDSAEVDSTQYVCNGANGSSGLTVLVSMTNESAGTNCANGGKKISAGNDANANSVLDANEITSTGYICNGADGSAGPEISWVDVAGASVQAVSNTGYMANNPVSQVTITVPAAPAVGDIVQVTGVGVGGWKIAQNAGQSIVTQNMPGSIGAVWTAHDANRSWYSVASSSDGSKLVAVVQGGRIWTSTDSGANWTARATDQNWVSVASSSDGVKLVAVVYGGQIWTSSDSGVNWTERATGSKYWWSVASSSDGAKLVAVVPFGQIWTSTDSGVTWTARATASNWRSVASSSDGAKLVAVVHIGQIYTSADSGVTWTAVATALNWTSVASSSDGAKLAGVVGGGQIYTSTPKTTTGTAGSISGGQYDAIELQCVGNNIFTILSHEGNLTVQ